MGGADDPPPRSLLAEGTEVWIGDPDEVWKAADVVSVLSSGNVIVRCEDTDEQQEIAANSPVYLRNVDQFSCEGLVALDDLTQLTHLHEAAVLNSLNVRFDVDKIYTFTGPILIAVNPFKTIYGLYDDETLWEFVTPRPVRTPHVFSIANAAYRGICTTKKSQSILISGESGAGKTETTKHVMQYLALAGAEEGAERSTVEKQVLESNPLLEAFGNARTLRNDNSSRFGKFIELQFALDKVCDTPKASPHESGDEEDAFSTKARLCGARIQTYLLEKVRVVDQQEGERNFHIFYQLCAAASQAVDDKGVYHFPHLDAMKSRFKDLEPFELDLSSYAAYDQFRYLSKSSVYQLEGVDDVEQFERTVAAMRTIGITLEEVTAIFQVVGGVLYLGNVLFEPPPGNSEGSQVCDSCREFFTSTCSLLGCSEEALEDVLCHKTIRTGSEVFKKPLDIKGAEDNRDALARALYGCLFLRIVQRTNQSIGYKPDISLVCGVLDIFGFECFKSNSFEQLCINFTNERLQQFFNTFVFKCEEELYQKEQIPWDPLDFPDNQDCVDLLQGRPTGLFAMLDEECLVPQGSDQGFCNKIQKQHSAHRRFAPFKTDPKLFTVNHFAGAVHYDSRGFLDKNKDQLSLDVQNVIKNSSNDWIGALFRDLLNRDGGQADDGPRMKARRAATVSSEFKEQLTSLMGTIQATEPHFIRCIKPNPSNAPDQFDRKAVTEQLRYGGVLQAVQVSRAGYPVRSNHHDCLLDYRVLASPEVRASIKSLEDQQAVSILLQSLSKEFDLPEGGVVKQSWAVGKTLTFFKKEAFEILSGRKRKLQRDAVICIQARWKGMRQRARMAAMLGSTIKIQALMRGKLARMTVRRMREEKAARRLQNFLRTCVSRNSYLRTLAKIRLIQRIYLGHKTRLFVRDLRLHRAASKIQATWKAWKERRRYVALKTGTIIAQRRWRTKLAKRQLKRLKQEAREAASLLGKVQNLQVEVKDTKKKLAEAEAQLLQKDDVISRLENTSAKAKGEQQQLQAKLSAKDDEMTQALEQLHKKHQEELAQLQASLLAAQAANGSPRKKSIGSTSAAGDSPSNGPSARSSTIAGSIAPLPPSSPDGASVHPSPAPPAKVASPQAPSAGPSPTSVPSVPTDLHSSRKAPFVTSHADPKVKSLLARMQEEEEEAVGVIEKLVEQNSSIQEEMVRIAEERDAFKQKLEQAEANYARLVRSSQMSMGGDEQAVSGVGRTLTPPRPGKATGRTTDLMLIGPPGVGKTSILLDFFTRRGAASHLTRMEEARMAGWKVIGCPSYTVEVANERVTIQDTPGDAEAYTLLLQMYEKVAWVAILYDTADKASYEAAQRFLSDVQHSSANFVLCGNTWRAQKEGKAPQVALSDVRDYAARAGGYAMEAFKLEEILRPLFGKKKGQTAAPQSKEMQRTLAQSDRHDRPAGQPSGFHQMMAGVKNLFTPSKQQKNAYQFLRVSLRAGTIRSPENSNGKHLHDQINIDDVRPVQELSESDSSVTCLCFGRQTYNQAFILLASAYKDGNIIVYRCYRTEMELEHCREQKIRFRADTDAYPPAEHSNVTVHCRMKGHSRAVTSLFFSLLEDLLVSTSIDKSVRCWDIDSGEMVKVFTDTSPALVAAFLPFNPQVFVAGNSNSVLRLVNITNGGITQKMKIDSEVRALCFDDSGLFCLAGTKNGHIHVLEACDSRTLRFKFKTAISKAAVTWITFVAAAPEEGSHHLLVNSCDGLVTIIDCTYGSNDQVLTNLTVRVRLKIQHSLLPLRNAHSPYGGGFLVSASENQKVCVFGLAKPLNNKLWSLAHHQSPVLAVAVNHTDTLLASGDSLGVVALWRRVEPKDSH